MIRNLACLFILLIVPLQLQADAIVRSSAMFADTIAEYHVEENRVRLDLEIGGSDIGAFRNLLPDAIYSDLGFGEQPLEERLRLFVTRDMAVLHDGKPLPGVLREIGPALRPLRDEVTGEELPTPEDQSEYAIAATVEFLLPERPSELTLMAPGATGPANIGFVLYHRGIPVNDFRYLSSGFTVRLDWDDPWYSGFPQRALKRQYEAPMAGFIYVEPFEVRKEIIVRPHDLQQWIDLGLEGLDVIPAEQQDEVKRKVVEFLENHFTVRIDGEPAEGTLDRVNFLRRTLKNSTVIDGQDVDLLPATLGVIYVFPTDGLPQVVEMDWDLFTEKMQRVTVASVDQAGPLPAVLEPDYAVLRWENFLKNPEIPMLVELRAPPTALQKASVWGKWLLLIVGLGLGWMVAKRSRGDGWSRPAAIGSVLALLGAMYLTMESRQARMDDERLQQLVGDLLHNVYRAFDFRGEEEIYDVLARSAAGGLLTDVYLEARRGLELASQGGARVKVKDIEVQESTLVGSSGDTLTVESRWNVAGSVGHWGHVHQRKNGYHAVLEISPVEGAWKLTGLEVLQEERL
ncbi:MAG: hypothetical protein KJO33_03275 [Gammaproteobacteria bacterium]|nr:hypothetical protein [Gammaproteobacteria bacterium]